MEAVTDVAVSDTLDTPSPAKASHQNGERKSLATRLVEHVQQAGVELWHAPDGTSCMTVPVAAKPGVAAHAEHHDLNGGVARELLRCMLFRDFRQAPTDSVVEEAVRTLAGIARFEGAKHPTGMRVAEHDGAIYLDLGGDAWDAVEVRAGAWQIVKATDCPVRFLRKPGMLPLPEPTRGGSVRSLAPLLNLEANSKEFVLVLTALVQMMRADGPFPLLAFIGEAGSGKSSAARMVRAVVDPNRHPLQTVPRSEEDLMIAARHSRVLALDNVSRIDQRLSDALCRLATGGGMTKRALYTNDDAHAIDVRCPVILTAIGEVVAQQDLLDRTLVISMRRIEDTARTTEQAVRERFEETHPHVLGALLDAVSSGLERLPDVHLDALPRMADLAVWGTACERGLRLNDGAVLQALSAARQEMVEASLDGDPLAEAICAVVEYDGDFEGTATALLDRLNARCGYGPTGQRAPRTWPKSANTLSRRLAEMAPGLRELGIEFERAKASGAASGGQRTRVLSLRAISVNEKADAENQTP